MHRISWEQSFKGGCEYCALQQNLLQNTPDSCIHRALSGNRGRRAAFAGASVALRIEITVTPAAALSG